MAYKRPTGAKLRQGNVQRKKFGLRPLLPPHTRRATALRTARKPMKPKKRTTASTLANAAKIALRGVRQHFGR